MEISQQPKFFAELLALAEAVDAELTDRRMEIYWRVLEDYDLATVQAALTQAMRRKWFKFPQPGEIIELIDGSGDDRAEQAWQRLHETASRYGGNLSLICEDQAIAQAVRLVFREWPEVGMLPDPTSDQAPAYHVKRREFLAAYRTAVREGQTCDRYLVGRQDAQNLATAAVWEKGILPEPDAIFLPRHGEAVVRSLRELMPSHPLIAIRDRTLQTAIEETVEPRSNQRALPSHEQKSTLSDEERRMRVLRSARILVPHTEDIDADQSAYRSRP